MLKILALAICLASILPISGSCQSSQPQSNQGDGNNSPHPSLTCQIKHDGTTIECDWPKDIPKSYFHRLFTAENTPNIALFFVGLGGVIAAVVTLVKIERQTAATEKQATHLVSSERPFLMIEARDIGSGSFDFYAVNCGKSPAQLIFINESPNVIAPKFNEELPEKPWYGHGFYEPDMMVFNQQWIAPAAERCIGTLDAEVIRIWVDGNNGLNTGEQILLVYGAIKYRGRFTEEVWQSKYCYRKMSRNLSMAGPYGWNDYT